MGNTCETQRPFDVFVIGGGINGVAIARDAAGRGLRVALCEQGDLAGATSSASSKLIHGGLRYLEHGEVRLVRQALHERERLLENAPHLVKPIDFVLPVGCGSRPRWMLRAGLWLYDVLKGKSRLPRSRAVDLRNDSVLDARLRRGFVFPDCFADDARLVVLTARDAADLGSDILVRTRCVAARREAGVWSIDVDSGEGIRTLHAHCLVNAAGPWVSRVLRDVTPVASKRRIRLVKGSHIVVPRLYDGDHAYLLQNEDRRVVFVIPFEGRFTIVGTTEVEAGSEPHSASCSEAEVAYLVAAARHFLDRRIDLDDIVATWSGLRPLVEDGRSNASAVTRDYVFELDTANDCPVLSVFGGKLTTHRRLAERALARLARWLPQAGPAWTAAAPLPGGAIADYESWLAATRTRYDQLPASLIEALGRRHGTRIDDLLAGAASLADLGEHFGAQLFERELDWFVNHEWAREADDVLLRRTKCGLMMSTAQKARLQAALATRTRERGARDAT